MKNSAEQNKTTTKKKLNDFESEKKYIADQNAKELQFLSVLVDNKSKLLDVASIVRPEDFEVEKLGQTYKALLLNDDNRDDLISRNISTAAIEKARDLKTYSGKSLIDYAKRVKENSIRRKINEILSKAKRKALSMSSDMLMASVQSQLQGVMGSISDTKEITAEKIVDKAIREIEEFSNMSSRISLPSTFSNLGNIVRGLFPHHIWMIGGFSGVGKSYFTLQLISDLMLSSSDDQGIPKLKTIIFSTENSAVDNLLRIVGCRTGLDFIDIKMGTINEEQKMKVAVELEILKKSPLLIYENIFDVNQIESIVTMHRMRNECDIVMIDYVQQLNLWEGDVYKRMSTVASIIQQMALKNDIPTVCVSQISNDEASKGGGKMGSFKGAGELRNIIDVGIWLEKGISEDMRKKFKDEFGQDEINPLMVEEKIAGSYNKRYIERDNEEILCAYVNKIRHARPGMAMFEYFTENCRINKEQYINKIDTEISDDDAVDAVNSLDI